MSDGVHRRRIAELEADIAETERSIDRAFTEPHDRAAEPHTTKEAHMYIGGGVLAVIIIVLLLILIF